MSPLVDAAGLRFSYGDGREALQGLDLAVAEGEHVALLGPNGSGKSTFARILAALDEPGSAAHIEVCGHDLTEQAGRRAARRQAGILFQDPESQVVGATVEEDVAFGLENLGLPAGEIAARVDEMLERFGLAELGEREPHLLSGGQKQRTALAGVLAVPRRLIVLDEPTAMLDTAGRKEVLKAVGRLREQGLTVIAVTQEMDEVPEARRAIVLEAGRVVFDGPPHELFAESDLLARLALGVPTAAEVALELRARGVTLPRLPFSARELADLAVEAKLPRTAGESAAAPSGREPALPGREWSGPAATGPVPAGQAVPEPAQREPALGLAAPAAAEPESTGPSPTGGATAGPAGLAVRCEGISFGYRDATGQVPALADVAFSLPAGSSTALLGPSGAGKSTLLLLLRGLLSADAGSVLLDGVAPGEPAYREVQRRVGLVFQRPEVQLFASSVREDVAFGPRQLEWLPAVVEAAVLDALEVVGLPATEYGDRHPYSLSGGEQRRLALAGVLAMRPGLLLLDEPFVSLDPGGRRELAGVLRRLQADGVTLLLTTHEIDQAWALCERRLLLRDGRLLAEGPWDLAEEGADLLTVAGLPLPTLVDLWRRLDLPRETAPRTASDAAARLAGGAPAGWPERAPATAAGLSCSEQPGQAPGQLCEGAPLGDGGER
jgi:energy-coupling factor transport system ATP-binding protein